LVSSSHRHPAVPSVSWKFNTVLRPYQESYEIHDEEAKSLHPVSPKIAGKVTMAEFISILRSA